LIENAARRRNGLLRLRLKFGGELDLAGKGRQQVRVVAEG